MYTILLILVQLLEQHGFHSSKKLKNIQMQLFTYVFLISLFTADNIWYRAVVLEGGENEVKVIYADFGNTETVPFSRILPIPKHLLQLPFQITRCTLTGRNNYFIHQWSSVGLGVLMLMDVALFKFLFR